MDFKARVWCVLMLFTLLCSCGQREDLAPVVESRWLAANSRQQTHVVVRGETLYAIAFHYDQDYRQLAMTNRLQSPYTLRVGQVLRVHASKNHPIRTTNYQPNVMYRAPSSPVYVSRPMRPRVGGWVWPAYGRVVATYMPHLGKKGIDIAGKKGDKIRAASGGTVAYAGNGIPGYGNLIIIKHNNQFLTAYGNNARNLVREGQSIKSGQVIAEMGVVDRRFWGVHFEIRKTGIPVNPLSYLQKG